MVVCLVITFYIFATECASEKILRIGQLTKIWTKVYGLLFGATL